jgi:NMD protein affecting ribosome stability and mRNA decay
MQLHCMKCGREIEENQVFCPDCLTHMAQNPVKSGTAVKLPPRNAEPLLKKRSLRKKRERKPEDVMAHQRTLIRRLILALVIAVLLLIAAGFLLFWMFKIRNLVDIPDLGL